MHIKEIGIWIFIFCISAMVRFCPVSQRPLGLLLPQYFNLISSFKLYSTISELISNGVDAVHKSVLEISYSVRF